MNSFSTDQHESVINYVRDFPFIWDLSHRDYHDNEKRDTVFDNLGRELGRDGEDVAKCWLALRRKYKGLKELEKAPKSGAPGGVPVRKYKKSEWALYPLLSFLDRTFKMRDFSEAPLPVPTEPHDVPNLPNNIATQLENIIPAIDEQDPVQFNEDEFDIVESNRLYLEDDLDPNIGDIVQIPATLQSIGSGNTRIYPTSSSQDQTAVSRNFQQRVGTQSLQSTNNSRQVRLDNAPGLGARTGTTRNNTTTAIRPILPTAQEQGGVPASKKRRAVVDQYAQERREIINSMKDSIATAAASTSTSRSIEQFDSRSIEPLIERTFQRSQTKYDSPEERMAHRYGEYVAMRFSNWSKEKQIQGFQIVNEAIEKAENIHMNS